MDEDPEITVLYDETDDDSSEDYYTTDVDIRQDEKQYKHEDHEKKHNSHEHNNANINHPQYDKQDYLQEQGIDPIE